MALGLAATAAIFKVVRGAGLEPAHPCGRQDLNLVRLPISPPARLKQGAGIRHRHGFLQCSTRLPPEIGELSILACKARVKFHGLTFNAKPRGIHGWQRQQGQRRGNDQATHDGDRHRPPEHAA